VRATEAFCSRIVQRAGLELSFHEDDLRAYLVAECWQLSLRYEPGRGSFQQLRRRHPPAQGHGLATEALRPVDAEVSVSTSTSGLGSRS
jgi:hypothetical protein